MQSSMVSLLCLTMITVSTLEFLKKILYPRFFLKIMLLQPETTAFPPGLKLKIIELLQNTVHVPSVQANSPKEDSLAPQGIKLKKIECTSTLHVFYARELCQLALLLVNFGTLIYCCSSFANHVKRIKYHPH